MDVDIVCTQDAIFHFSPEIYATLDFGDKGFSVFVDLPKAFDTVTLQLLQNSPDSIGIRGFSLKIFQRYLTRRNQYVKMNKCTPKLHLETYTI